MVDKSVSKNVPKPTPAKSVAPASKPAPAAPASKPVVAANPAPKSVIEKPVPVVAAKSAPVVTETAAVLAAVVAAPEPVQAPKIAEGTTKMNETINHAKNAAQSIADTAKVQASEVCGDLSTRAKSAMEQGSKTVEDMVEMSKGNIEAVVASGRVAAKGAQDIAKYSAEYGRKAIEEATSNAKRFAAVKSPTEFFSLQSEIAKTQLDAFVGEASKFSESYLKLLGEIAQPIQNRYAVAVEKVKTTVAA